MSPDPNSQASVPERYEVLEVLIEDDIEIVLRCRDTTLGREVLLKRPGRALTELIRGTADDSRALREARSLAQIQAPGVQRLIDVLEEPGGPLLVLEPVPGESLAELLEHEGKLDPEDVIRLARELSQALAAVHAIGAVHRDLAAEHVVMRPDGSACLTGFKLAKFTADAGGQSSIAYDVAMRRRDTQRQLLPAYPAPEQFGGEVANPRTDIFGLGCLLYRCVTGVDAFPNLLETGWQPPKEPARLVPECPKALSKAILSCIARSPVGRLQNVADLASTLPEAAKSSTGSKRGWIAGAASVAAIVAAGAFFMPRDSGVRGVPTFDSQAQLAGSARGGAGYLTKFSSSHALLIGIGDAYGENGFSPLRNAEGDVIAIDERLRELPRNWQTELLLGENATRGRILEKLEKLKNKLGPDDQVLIFFAGHGVPDDVADSSGWIVPANGRLEEDDPSKQEWIRFDEFASFFKEAAAKHILVALDCCFSGRIARVTASRGSAQRQTHELRVSTPAHVVLTSGSYNEAVIDGVGEHSPFAQGFLDALSDKELVALTSMKLYSRISDIYEASEVPHLPVHAHPAGGALGEFVFVLQELE